MSCHDTPTLTLTAGQIWDIPIEFTNEAGTPVNLTGATVHLMGKVSLDEDDGDAALDISQTSHTNAAGGETTLPIDLSELEEEFFISGGRYIASLWIEDANDQRIPYGLIHIKIDPSAKFKPDAV